MSIRRSAPAPAPAAPAKKAKKVRDLAAERKARYERLVREDSRWAAYDANRKYWASIRTAFQAGERETHEQKLIAEVISDVSALQTHIAQADADLKACAVAADALWYKQHEIDWRDEANDMFLTDCQRYCEESDCEGALRVLDAFLTGMF